MPEAIKDGDIAALVNRLRDIAVKYRDTQQLRERIAAEIRPLAAHLAARRMPCGQTTEITGAQASG